MMLKLKLSRLTGERTCLSSGFRMKTLVRGTVSRDRMLADETIYLVTLMRQLVGDDVRVPENDSIAKVYGERTGNCTTSSPRGKGR